MCSSSFKSQRSEWTKVLLGCLLIGLLSLASSLLSNFLRPSPLPLIPPFLSESSFVQIDPQQAEEGAKSGEILFLDSRYHSRYKRAHLPRAMSLPPKDFSTLFPLLYPLIPERTLIVTYGEGWGRPSEKELSYLLLKAGTPKERIRILNGGFRAWEKEGYPVASRERR